MAKIKRENWKGKFFLVIRNDKGKIITRRKWTRKFTKKQARRKFKQDKTLKKGQKRKALINVVEIVDKSERIILPNKNISKKYQYIVDGELQDGNVISARSLQHDITFPVSKARNEATESFFERLAQSQNLDYDAEEGMKVFEQGGIKLTEGIVYYKAIT